MDTSHPMMSTHQYPSITQPFHDHPSFDFNFHSSTHPIQQHFSTPQLLSQKHLPPPPPPPLPILKSPLCPLCKGQKYNFTAYFHNALHFSEPPHHLLGFVEDSYLLKNTLQSLLVTYISRDPLARKNMLLGMENGDHSAMVCENERRREVEAIKRRVKAWEDGVGFLLERVRAFGVLRGVYAGLGLDGEMGRVKEWVGGVAEGVGRQVEGSEMLDLGRWGGSGNGMVLEFRRLWEGVWKGFLSSEEKCRKFEEVEREEIFEMDVDGLCKSVEE